VLTINKPQLVSFFVYRRQSRDRFRINHLMYSGCWKSWFAFLYEFGTDKTM